MNRRTAWRPREASRLNRRALRLAIPTLRRSQMPPRSKRLPVTLVAVPSSVRVEASRLPSRPVAAPRLEPTLCVDLRQELKTPLLPSKREKRVLPLTMWFFTRPTVSSPRVTCPIQTVRGVALEPLHQLLPRARAGATLLPQSRARRPCGPRPWLQAFKSDVDLSTRGLQCTVVNRTVRPRSH
jgi:hypothetical protein